MTDVPAKQSRKLPLAATLQALGVAGTTLAGYLVGSSETLILPSKPTTAAIGALVGILGIWVHWSYGLWKQTSDLRLRDRFDHDSASDMSIERAGNKKGRKVCTRCLNQSPARDYPLHDPYGTGRWKCSGCDGPAYEDASYKASQKLHFEEEERKHKNRNSQYS